VSAEVQVEPLAAPGALPESGELAQAVGQLSVLPLQPLDVSALPVRWQVKGH